ncbi:hypothetical protein IAT38_002492 [Cryptococcus sp. DSM 104549]
MPTNMSRSPSLDSSGSEAPPDIPEVNLPAALLPWTARFPLDKLTFKTAATTTRDPGRRTYAVFHATEEHGIRVVWDPTLNSHLAELFMRELKPNASASRSMKTEVYSSRKAAVETEVDSETTLSSTVMSSNLFRWSTKAIGRGFDSSFHGKWAPCSNSTSGSADWKFVRSTPGEPTVAVIEVKLPSVLTAGDGSGPSVVETSGENAGEQVSRGGGAGAVGAMQQEPRYQLRQRSNVAAGNANVAEHGVAAEGGGGEEGGRYEEENEEDDEDDEDNEMDWSEEESGNGEDDEGDGCYIPPSDDEEESSAEGKVTLKLEKLIRGCKQPGGVRVILMEEGNDGEKKPVIRVVDEDGNVVDGWVHWANGLSQLWEQHFHYGLDALHLTSYNVWIPFQVDSEKRNLLRMGQPVYRATPGAALAPGEMSIMQMTMAAVIDKRPPPPFTAEFNPLPVAELSGSVLQSLQNSRAGSKTTRSGGGTVEGAAASGEAAVAVSLRVIVPERRSPNALHFFLQSSMDDSLITGHFNTSMFASPHSDIQPHPKPPAVREASLVLVQYLTSGRLWDSYHAVLSAEGLPTKQLIAKITSPETYDEGYEHTQELFVDSRAAIHAYMLEAAMYSGPLAGLQGGAVPAVYGSFEGVFCVGLGPYGRSRVRIELLEDVGEPAAGEKGLRDLSWADKLKVVDLYNQLHAVRVQHGDVEPRHVHRRADGRLALLDFDSSREVQAGREGDALLVAELSRVKTLLGLAARKGQVEGGKAVKAGRKVVKAIGKAVTSGEGVLQKRDAGNQTVAHGVGVA